MNYASVCSGVESASLAWEPLGWKPVWLSEIEPFPSAVLAARFPNVPNLGDMTKIKGEEYDGAVDLLVGGTPCQGFSVAGKQGGLDDPRSVLCLTYVGLLKTMRPTWFVWENVPGVFSTAGGEDFRSFIRAIDEIGYSCAWRVLDAQYVRVDGYPRAVPQRRRRVFVVGHISGDWRYPASVLFEPDSVQRDTPPRRIKGQGFASCFEGGIDSARWWNGDNRADTLTTTSNNQLMPDQSRLQCIVDIRQLDARETEISPTLVATDYKGGKAVCFEHHAQDARLKPVDVAQTLSARMGTGGNNLPLVQETIGFIKNDAGGAKDGYGSEVFPTLRSQVIPAVARQECFNVTFCDANGVRKDRRDGGLYVTEAESGRTITTGGTNADTVVIERENENATVRRLLPVECERLMGFPDNWTRIPWRGKPEDECPDAPRYKACGNSMCVNVMRWIGMRIELIERKSK